MLTKGVAHLFDSGRITGPISWASHIIEHMLDNGFWPDLPKVTPGPGEVDKVGDLTYLIRKFITLKYNVPKDFNWQRHILDDMVMVNTASGDSPRATALFSVSCQAAIIPIPIIRP